MADYSNLRATSGISDSTIEQVKQLIDETCNEFSKILEVVPIGTQLSIGEDDIKYSCFHILFCYVDYQLPIFCV